MQQEEAEEIVAAMESVQSTLAAADIGLVDLSGRPKNLYSVWCKMAKKGVPLDDIHDVRALRLIVADKADCYAALRAVQSLWPPLAGRTKDYVRHPKANRYRSLHTVVRDGSGRPLEIQIRTPEMHAVAEFGVAAHWRYKEGRHAGSLAFMELQAREGKG